MGPRLGESFIHFKIPRHRAKFEDPRFILFPITRLSNRLVEELEAPRVGRLGSKVALLFMYQPAYHTLAAGCLIRYTPRTQIKYIWILRQLSILTALFRGLDVDDDSCPLRIFRRGQTLITPPIYIVELYIHIHTSAYTHVILLRTYRTRVSATAILGLRQMRKHCNDVKLHLFD